MKLNYFNFEPKGNDFFLTNDLGKYIYLSKLDFFNLVEENYNEIENQVIEELKEKYFIFDETLSLVENMKDSYRGMKNYLFTSTSLHIFVLTNSCNLNCVYCQAQDKGNIYKGIMTKETARKAVNLALMSPAENLNFEFQGGEPLINFEILKYIVEYSEKRTSDRNLTYSVVTNTTLLTDDMIDFIKKHNISVATSVDGNEIVHNKNRSYKNGKGSFASVKNNISKLKNAGISVGAIQTTTRFSLKYPKQIVDQYVQFGMKSIFIRPLTPLGYANNCWDEIGYTSNEFIEFYKTALEYILVLNKSGIFIAEGHARIFLRKILAGLSENYMELRSPCGAAIGQMAYYYDGNIYTCDEGRMLAEMGDDSFCIGNVNEDKITYEKVMDCETTKITSQASILESIPSCSDCVYNPFCGVCPVINLALEKNIYSKEPNGYRCRVYKGILDTIFELIEDEQNVAIFKNWLK